MSFIAKLDALVKELNANPLIQVMHYCVFPPDLDAIMEVEEKIGYKLDPSISDFYKECGGVQLLWLHKENSDFNFKKEHIENELVYLKSKNQLHELYSAFEGELSLYHTSDVVADEIIPDGVILIPSIKTSFLDQNYNSNSDEYGIEADVFNSFGVFNNAKELKIRRFDMFDVTINIAFILDGNKNPFMLTAYDKYEYGESSIIKFKEYLHLLIVSKGSTKRGKGFLLSSEYERKSILIDDINAIEQKGEFVLK